MQNLEKTIYHDNWLDHLFIGLFVRKIAKTIGTKTNLKGYDSFVEVSKQVAQGRNALEQQVIIAKVLRSLIPAQILYLIRSSFSPVRWVCELNARSATLFSEWLVGPSEVKEVEITDSKGQIYTQRSGVQIKKCRFLESSGCVGMCINLCKIPTQNFFTQEFGIPLTMTPNFEDLSCEMVFGQLAPPLEQEQVYYQPCLQMPCSIAPTKSNIPTKSKSNADSSQPCPQIRLSR